VQAPAVGALKGRPGRPRRARRVTALWTLCRCAWDSVVGRGVELHDSRSESLTVFGIAAVFRPIPAATSDCNSQDVCLATRPLRVQRKDPPLVQTDYHAFTRGPRFGQVVLVVVWSTKPARGKAETGDLVLREKRVDDVCDRGGLGRV
jgi:hypothetical protein